MQLWINTVNLEVLDNLESLLYSDDKTLIKWFSKNFPGEVAEKLSPQYELQVKSMGEIRKKLGGKIFKNIKGIYFGTEQCEFLMPTLSETQEAIKKLKEFDKKYTTKDIKQFTLITPYYGNLVVRKRIEENLEWLNENAKYVNPKLGVVEIVVNDIGTLQLIKKYKKLIPVVGRLLVKTLKNPLTDTFGLEKNIQIPGEMMKNKTQEEIKELKKKLAKNQRKGYGRCSLHTEEYQEWMKENCLVRAGMDYQEGYKSLFQDLNDINMDIYYPYGIVFVGRLCDTSAIEDIKRGYYPIDKVCPRTCNKFDMFIKNFDPSGYKIFQRGNAQFRSALNLDYIEELIHKYDNRLIYTPLI